MTGIGKEFGWTGPGKYVSRSGSVFSVFTSGDPNWPFIGLREDGFAASWKASGLCAHAPGQHNLIRPYAPPREKLRGRLNVDPGPLHRLFETREEANKYAMSDRIVCVYVEETDPPEGGE